MLPSATPTATAVPSPTPTPTPVEPVAVLTSSWSQPQVVPGDIVQGRIVIVNRSMEPVEDIVIGDLLPKNLIPLRIETSKGIISFSPPHVDVRMGRLEPGEEVEIIITAQANGEGGVDLQGSPSWYQG